jgi:uncharacterized protein
MSGGSTSILTTPSWLAMGYPLPTAVAADKLAGMFWTLFGARNYLRHRSIDRVLIAGMVGSGILGAIAGTRVATSVDPALLKRVAGGLIVIAVVIVGLKSRLGGAVTPRTGRLTPSLVALPLGFYEGLLGSGNGIATTMLLTFTRGFDLLTALGHYYLIAASWCGVAAFAYYRQGVFDWALALPAASGAVLGGYLGSRIGSTRGLGFVRVLFLGAGLSLGLKLVLAW